MSLLAHQEGVLFSLPADMGNWGSGRGLTFALVTQIRSGGAKSSLRPALPHLHPRLLEDLAQWDGAGDHRLPGELGRERFRVGNGGTSFPWSGMGGHRKHQEDSLS